MKQSGPTRRKVQTPTAVPTVWRYSRSQLAHLTAQQYVSGMAEMRGTPPWSLTPRPTTPFSTSTR